MSTKTLATSIKSRGKARQFKRNETEWNKETDPVAGEQAGERQTMVYQREAKPRGAEETWNK